VTARLRVDLNAITKKKVHGLIEGYKDAPNKLAIVKEDAHNDPVGIGRSQPRSGADSHGNGRMGSGGGHAEGGATVYSNSKVWRRGGRSNSAGHVGAPAAGTGTRVAAATPVPGRAAPMARVEAVRVLATRQRRSATRNSEGSSPGAGCGGQAKGERPAAAGWRRCSGTGRPEVATSAG
jgi:hypothetical protein